MTCFEKTKARKNASHPEGSVSKNSFLKLKEFLNRNTIFYGSVVKRLRHRPFTAVTRVRFSSESLAIINVSFTFMMFSRSFNRENTRSVALLLRYFRNSSKNNLA